MAIYLNNDPWHPCWGWLSIISFPLASVSRGGGFKSLNDLLKVILLYICLATFSQTWILGETSNKKSVRRYREGQKIENFRWGFLLRYQKKLRCLWEDDCASKKRDKGRRFTNNRGVWCCLSGPEEIHFLYNSQDTEVGGKGTPNGAHAH